MPALVALAAALFLAAPTPSTSSTADGADSARCRGPEALANYRALTDGRKIFIRRVKCGEARTVVRRFAARCVAAFNSQGTCRIRTRKRWSCASRLIGSASEGVPSLVECSARRARVRFTVRLSMESIDEPPAPTLVADAGPPYSKARNCVDGGVQAETAAPPGPPNETFEVRTFEGLPLVIAEAVQAQLVEHSVGARLVNGLVSRPLGSPTRVPVFLRKGNAGGVTQTLCDLSGVGSVVEIGPTVEAAAQISAHELFHAHASGIRALRPPTAYAWFEDPAADWSVWRSGLHFVPSWDGMLQQPNLAADTMEPDAYRYALWRFVQFLDDKGMVHEGNTWPLIRAPIVAQDQPAGLDGFLRGKQTSLGEELAAFWGEHLKAKPRRPPRLVPAPANSETVTIPPGQTTWQGAVDALHTKLLDFKLADNVRRVEFEFSPPTRGYFWGLVAEDESRRFQSEDAVVFCVGEETGDDLAWPGNFPVTFTNGFLSGTSVTGRIHVYAQTQTPQCKGPPNKACKVLDDAGARPMLGPDLPNIGGFSGSRRTGRRRPSTSCAYKGSRGLATIQIERWPSSKALRRWLIKKSEVGGWRRIKLGDIGIAFTAPDGKHCFVQVAVGRQRLTISVSGTTASTSHALELAQNAYVQVS